ncbi:CTP synthase C-terminal region-related (seleno)protein [Streptacidiphilus griseoplanus]|uniref:CTP synthase C-terminal region-related (seleno)protein n=1 Tax=Peterkaempfera griseoplana TaxID=66896 RepID=UPI0006E31CBA|nr:gamma-glutamyl-gamma-aminobutyrate hydrolase family protein [Peterkaempfera griseoplana]
MTHTARVALVGDRSPHVRSHTRIPGLLDALRERDGLDLDAYWIPTQDIADNMTLAGFDAIWVLPGSPYRSEVGALAAIRTARENHIPLLGTCAGFQHVLLEYARNVAGLATAGHAENAPDTSAADAVVVPLACSLVGHEGAIEVTAGSLAEALIGAEQSVERYHCNFGASPHHVELLRTHGLQFTGTDTDGEVRIAELPEHPFFLATLFQPELAGDGARPHPFVRGLAAAAVAQAKAAA